MSLRYNPFVEMDSDEIANSSVRSLGAFAYTDYGNAERLVQLHGDDMIYVPAWKIWLLWDGKRWRPDDDGGAERNAKDTIRTLYAIASKTEDDKQREALASHARKSEGAGRLRAMMDLAQSELSMSVRPDQLDTHHWLLNVQNGTLNLRTGDLKEHDRHQLLTKVLPVAYDPTAQCKRWDRFLKEVLPDEEVRTFLHRAVGYSLTGLSAEEVMFILLGPGSNGKSKLLETLRLLFGPFAQTAPTALLMQNFMDRIPADLARLPGARFVTVVESERGQKLAEGTIKSITSGDRVSARGLYQNPFDFNPICKIWLATNHLPDIKGDDDGIWRRIILLNFNQRIGPDQRDKHLLDKLRKELPGVLRWAAEGCRVWQSEGFSPPESVRKAISAYRQQMDMFGQFLRDCTATTPNGFALTDELFLAYTHWCEVNGVRYPITKIDLGRRLKERGHVQGRRDMRNHKGERVRPRGWVGLQLAQSGHQ